MSEIKNLQDYFGNIDIYLFDQILKKRFDSCSSILDAGCGGGRNIIYFMRNKFDVYGIDSSPHAINQVKQIAADINPELPQDNFLVAEVGNIPHPNEKFDCVIGNAILHFAKDESHFYEMLNEMWRVLNHGGLLFIRLATSIGMNDQLRQLGGKRYQLPDGSKRFLANETMLLAYTNSVKAKLADPIKTTNVSNLRCMTTWCLIKEI